MSFPVPEGDRMIDETAPRPPAADDLAAYMAGMAAGDAAHLWRFLECAGDRLGSVVRAVLRDFGHHRLAADPDAVDELVLDAAFLLFDRAGAWRPGGAAPWHWARPAIRAMVAAWLGHRTAELDAERHGSADGPPPSPAPTAEVFADLARSHPGVAALDQALRIVATPRDRGVVVEFLTQKALGDPSPSHTVAQEMGLSAVNVRQIVTRVRRRVLAVLGSGSETDGWLAA
jgi:hypothetical protein